MRSAELPPPVSGLEPTLPSSWYRSAEAFAREQERIFRREWICVGREEELRAPEPLEIAAPDFDPSDTTEFWV